MKIILKKLLTSSLFVICYLSANAAYSSEPYFAVEESFALSTMVENGKYPITTFIPRTMLLYVSDINVTKKISNRNYLQVKTQDGVSVFVDATTVSNKPYRKILGKNEVIFNSPISLCRKIGCDTDSDVDTWKIHAGDAFHLTQNDHDEFLKIIGYRYEQEISGFISPEKLEEFIENGVVTRTDRRHPKYTITKVKSKSLNTKCSEVVSKGTNKKIGGSIDIEIPFLKAFGIGVSGGVGAETNINITTSYGEIGHEYSFYTYRISDNDTHETRNFVAQIDYECQKGPLISPRTIISRVDMKDITNDIVYSLLFSDYGVSKELKQYTGSPYLYSVNTYRQYIDLMERLGGVFSDRTIAGYFLSEFNRSCRSKDRGRDLCSNHSYSK